MMLTNSDKSKRGAGICYTVLYLDNSALVFHMMTQAMRHSVTAQISAETSFSAISALIDLASMFIIYCTDI